MGMIQAIKALLPVKEWRQASGPTASVSFAVGDDEYEFTEIGIHENRLYQIVHYTGGGDVAAVLAVDVIKGPSIVDGVEKFITEGLFDVRFFEKMEERFGPCLNVALTHNGKVHFGLFGPYEGQEEDE